MSITSPSGRIRAALAAFLAFSALLLGGCAGGNGGASYTMHLDAYAEHVAYGKRYVVLQGIMEVPPKEADLFKSVAANLDEPLGKLGYSKAPSLDQADLGIYLAYKVVKDARHDPFDNFQPRQQSGIPTPEFLKWEYTRDLLLEAVDLARYKAGDPHSTVWKIHVVSRGPTEDLKKAMPYICAALAKYMGQSVEAYVEVDDSYNVHPFKPVRHGRRP